MGKVATILVPVMAVALVGTTFWGYQEHQEKNAILIKAENQYQQAFHNLTYYMDSLQDELGKSIAMNSRKQLGPCLTNVWRLAYSAQNSVGQLPLTLMPFNKTEEFLAKIGDFSYRVAARDLNQEPLTEAEWKTLHQLYQKAGEIQTDLRKVQSEIFEKQLRWMDVETALASEDKKTDNSIIDGFKQVDERVSGYNDVDFGKNVQSAEEIRIKKLQNLKGKDVTEDEAKSIALSFVGVKDGNRAKVNKTNKGAIFGAYDISVEHPESKSELMVEVTKKGGNVIWFIDTREIGPVKISIENAKVRAERFLLRNKMSGFENVKIEQYDNVAVFTYVQNKDNVLIYPESVTVKVALDNGQVIGFNGEDYIVNRGSKIALKPKISEQEARKRINPNMKIEESRLALIMNDLHQEVLCYEFSGTINQNHYLIYINASNGDEEKVESLKLIEDEKI